MGMTTLMAALGFHPPRPERIVRSSSLVDQLADGELLYYGVGRSATVIMAEDDDRIFLRTNGLPEAWMNFRGSPPFASGSSNTSHVRATNASKDEDPNW